MDDDRWKEIEQVNPKYTKFQNDCIIYHLLEEVFAKQGATGEFSTGFENDPRNSSEKLEMKNEARGAQGKSRLEIEERDAEVEIVTSKKEKGKKGKRKRKSGDTSSGSPMATASGSITDRYFQALNTIESLVNRKKTSSMSVSISSPTKQASRANSKKSAHDIALVEHRQLARVDYNAKMEVTEILKDPQELAIWDLAGSDANCIKFMKHRGCLPPDWTPR